MTQQSDPTPVTTHSWSTRLLRPLGLRYVSGRQIAFVMHRERFHKWQTGPAYFWVVPGVQRVLLVVDTFPDNILAQLSEIQTSDGLQIGMHVLLEYNFDPRQAPNVTEMEKAKVALRCKNLEDRRAIVTFFTQRAAQSVASYYNAEEICRGRVWDEFERRLFDALDARILPFGMKLFRPGCAIQRAIPPAMLNWRLEMAAQRAANINNLSQYEPYEIAQALRAEAVEALKSMSGGSPYLNLHDLAPPEEAQSQSPRLIEGQSRAVEREQPAQTTYQEDPKPVEPKPQPPQPQSKERRPRSRL
jgi:hypothetical protein